MVHDLVKVADLLTHGVIACLELSNQLFEMSSVLVGGITRLADTQKVLDLSHLL
jgi:hypothetical protein